MRGFTVFNLGSLVDWLNLIVLIGTAAIVWIYTKAAQRANEIQERPVINLRLESLGGANNQDYRLVAKNVGKGEAYNVKFSTIEAGGWKYLMRLSGPNSIVEVGVDRDVNIRVARGTEHNGLASVPFVFTRLISDLFPDDQIEAGRYFDIARSAGTLLVHYVSLTGVSYYSIFRLYSEVEPLLGGSSIRPVVEFIAHGTGETSVEDAKRICEARVVSKSQYYEVFE